MGNLAKDGLGKVVLEDRGTVFYKCSPIQVEKEALDRYTVDDVCMTKKFEKGPLSCTFPRSFSTCSLARFQQRKNYNSFMILLQKCKTKKERETKCLSVKIR